ncbi:MAG TPA: hypothetical protein VJ962_09460 [Clostridia bacterium]|nr:hypothetical protein [Clostridia bacterium]
MKKVLLAFLIVVFLGFISCGQKTEELDVKEVNGIDKTIEAVESVDVEENLMKLFPSGEKVKYEEKGELLSDKLLADEAAGKITRSERARYTLMMAYNQEAFLPEAYQGYEGWVDTHYELRYIRDHWDDFSKEEQDEIIPLIVPIEDPRSIHHPKTEKSSIIPIAYADSDRLVKRSFIIDNQTIEIVYVIQDEWLQVNEQWHKIEDVAMALGIESVVEEAIRKGWDKFKPLMKKTPSSKVLVELIPMELGLEGEEWHDGTQYRIRLNLLYLYLPKRVQSTSVHELFHVFQDEYGIGFKFKEEKWLCEATAVWSENYVYPDYNIEHDRLPGFFNTLEKDRINFGKAFEYDSYMLFYYLTDYANMNFIREAIEKAGTGGNAAIRPYLNNKIPNRKEVYAEFALYNWNKVPVKIYNDHGPLKGSPNGGGFLNKFMINETEDEQSIHLKPGAIEYYHYDFDRSDEDLHHVNIDFSNTFLNDQDISRQALIKINGAWFTEIWDDVSQKRYCSLRNDDELVEELILIYSNSSFTDEKNKIDYFKVWTESCHEAMALDISVTYEYLTDYFEWSLEGQLTDRLVLKDHYMFLVESSDYSLNGKGVLEGEYSVNTNGKIGGSIEEPSVENSLVRIILPMGEEHEETLEIYKAFGIEEITPQGGVLVTLPFAMSESSMRGSTTFELPEPIGTMNMNVPFNLDGISQAIAVEINPFDWGPKGLSFTREIDLLKHKPAILDIYDLSPAKMKETLKMLQENYGDEGLDYNISQEELDEINEMLEGMPNVEGMDIPGMGSNNSSQLFNELMGAMSFDRSRPDVSATLTIKVKGRYIDE